MSDWLGTAGTSVLFVSVMWLVFGFAIWILLAVLAVVLTRRQPRAVVSGGGWKPSLSTSRGLALVAVYISVTLVVLGCGAVLGWNAVGDDRFGVFMAMTVVADVLTVLLVAAYIRVLVLFRRGEPSPGRVLWMAFAATILGQAITLVILLVVGLSHAPTFFE